MPYLLIYSGCIGLVLSCIGIYIPYIQQLDFHIVDWMSQHRTEYLTPAAVLLSRLGGLPAMLVLLFFACLQQLYVKKYTHIVLICLGLFGGSAIGWLLKYIFERARPDFIYQIVTTYGASFPSGHSLYAALLSCGLIFIFYQHKHATLIRIFACTWLILMGMSRVYLGAHFPTDVIAGWSVAFIWSGILWLMFLPYCMKQK